MTYQFDVDVASKVGVEEAIVVQNFAFWIAKNKANNQGFHEGRYWTYNTAAAFVALFPFWSEKQVRRILDSLVKKKVLLTGEFNKSAMNHTKWFAFTDQWDYLAEVRFAQTGKSISPNGQFHLPERELHYTDSKPDKDSKRKRFTPPSLPELEAKCKEIGLPQSEASKFFNYHSSKGWKVGRTPMVCWKSALNTWKINHSEFQTNGSRNGSHKIENRDPSGWLEWVKTQPVYVKNLQDSTTGMSYRFAPEFMKLEFIRTRKWKTHEARS